MEHPLSLQIDTSHEAIIILVNNLKGGVGKTTTAAEVGVCASMLGLKVLFIDIDKQCNLTQIFYPNHLELKKEETSYAIVEDNIDLPVFKTHYKDVWLCPASLDLEDVNDYLSARSAKELKLKEKIEKQNLRKLFDLIIIDCPPETSTIVANAMACADYAIIPTDPSVRGLRGIDKTIKKMEEIKHYYNPKIEILGLLQARRDQNTNLSKEIYKEMLRLFTPTETFKFSDLTNNTKYLIKLMKSIEEDLEFDWYRIEVIRNNVVTVSYIDTVKNKHGKIIKKNKLFTDLTPEEFNNLNLFESKVFQTTIPDDVKLNEAAGLNQSIFEYKPSSNGAIAYRKLVEEEILPKILHINK